MVKINWDGLLCDNNLSLFRCFSNGTVSGRTVERAFFYSNQSRQVRSLIRDGGVKRARKITREALRRRGQV